MVSEIIENSFGIKISSNVKEIIEDKSEVVTLNNKDIVIMEGEKADKLFLMIHGIVRGYYIDEKGNDITKCFADEGKFFGTECFLSKNNATFTIECLEDCKVIKFQYSLVDEIVKNDEELNALFNKLLIEEVYKLEKQKKNYAVMDAEKRYKDFCINYPNLSERVNLQYIASYIGIRPASLSRIRKKFN